MKGSPSLKDLCEKPYQSNYILNNDVILFNF